MGRGDRGSDCAGGQRGGLAAGCGATTTECPGRVEKFLIELNESYPVGAVLGYLEASVEDATRLGLDDQHPEKNGEEKGEESSGKADAPKQRVQPTVRGLPVPANAAGASYM